MHRFYVINYYQCRAWDCQLPFGSYSLPPLLVTLGGGSAWWLNVGEIEQKKKDTKKTILQISFTTQQRAYRPRTYDGWNFTLVTLSFDSLGVYEQASGATVSG